MPGLRDAHIRVVNVYDCRSMAILFAMVTYALKVGAAVHGDLSVVVLMSTRSRAPE